MTNIPDRYPYEEFFQSLIAQARQSMDDLGIPGVAVGLSANNQEYRAGLGVTGLEDPQPVTPGTIFQIASITKTVTATALFRLVEQGEISLDDRVREFIPSFKVRNEDASARVTIRHLLNHTAGWFGDFFYNTGEEDEALAEYIALMADLPQLAPLGTTYAYNNAAFNVLGRIIEIIAGRQYERVMHELVLGPLGMDSSYFFPSEAIGRCIAAGYSQKEDGTTEPILWFVNRGEAPCGGLATDIGDLLRYARYHMGDGTAESGERILSSSTLAQMQTPTIQTDKQAWMGMNWFIDDSSGLRLIYHNGSTNGQETALWLAPAKKVALAIMTNHFKGEHLCENLTLMLKQFLA